MFDTARLIEAVEGAPASALIISLCFLVLSFALIKWSRGPAEPQ